MSNIPKARSLLNQIARDTTDKNAAKLIRRVIKQHLFREPFVRRAPATSARLTPMMKRKIRAFAEAHPMMAFQTIGEKLRVNGGRVSETMHGK